MRRIFSSLMQDGILTADDREFIQNQGRTRMEKVELFLDMIPGKGPKAFESLCRALKRNRYDFLVQRLGLTSEELKKLEGEVAAYVCTYAYAPRKSRNAWLL